jgi:hypothetical protein
MPRSQQRSHGWSILGTEERPTNRLLSQCYSLTHPVTAMVRSGASPQEGPRDMSPPQRWPAATDAAPSFTEMDVCLSCLIPLVASPDSRTAPITLTSRRALCAGGSQTARSADTALAQRFCSSTSTRSTLPSTANSTPTPTGSQRSRSLRATRKAPSRRACRWARGRQRTQRGDPRPSATSRCTSRSRCTRSPRGQGARGQGARDQCATSPSRSLVQPHLRGHLCNPTPSSTSRSLVQPHLFEDLEVGVQPHLRAPRGRCATSPSSTFEVAGGGWGGPLRSRRRACRSA